MKIVQLHPSHVDQIHAIEQCISPGPWTRAMFEQECVNAQASFFAAVRMQVVLGFGGFWNLAGSGHISNIGVMPRFQRRGIGAGLLGFLLDEMRTQGIVEALLEVRAGNQAAISLYEQKGFVLQGRRRDYYKNGDDALVYVLPLS